MIAVRPALAHSQRHPAHERGGPPAQDKRVGTRSGRSRRQPRRKDRVLPGRHRGSLRRRGEQARESLLLSANEKHPNGLANGSDQVGRNYMFHNSQAVVALSLEPNLTQFQKTISLNDFYFRDGDF